MSLKKDEIRVEEDPERLRPIDADLQVPDCRKFKKHTGWEPQIPYEKTMEDLKEMLEVADNILIISNGYTKEMLKNKNLSAEQVLKHCYAEN